MREWRSGLFIFFFLFFTSTVFAQLGNKIVFNKTKHDFGDITENAGPVSYDFTFTNRGNVALELKDVKASCGCTTPDWSSEPILPGSKGRITARFNPHNRPGVFEKSLTVTSNMGTVTLEIKGYVVPLPSSPETDFPAIAGNLRLKSKTLNLGKITTRDKITKSFTVYNQGDKPIIFSDETTSPSHISINMEPLTVRPGGKAELIIAYDPIAKGELGYLMEYIDVVTTDEKDPIKKLNVMVTIQEYFPAMTDDDYSDYPHIEFDATEFDFKDVTSGNKVSHQFKVINSGKNNLNIRSVRTNCNCVVADLESQNIAPGDTAILNVTFNTINRKGIQHKAISVYSNDPRKPSSMLTIKSSIKERK